MARWCSASAPCWLPAGRRVRGARAPPRARPPPPPARRRRAAPSCSPAASPRPQLDPANSIIAGDVYTLDKIIEPLYVTSPAGELTPWLAESHTTSADGLTWTFNLRPGVKFSDGKPLTADGRRLLDQARGRQQERAAQLPRLRDQDDQGAAAPTRSCSRSSAPWAPFLSDISVFANAIMPANFGGKSEKAFFAKPVGTGAVRAATRSRPSSNLTLKRNPHYWQAGKPYVDAVQINYVSDDNQRVLQVQSGQAHIIDSVPPANVASLKSAVGRQRRALPGVGGRPARLQREAAAVRRPPRAPRDHLRDQPPGAGRRRRASAPRKPGGSFFPPSLAVLRRRTRRCSPTASSAAKAELAKSQVPARLRDQAADLRRRAEVGRVRADHPAVAGAARTSR